MVRAAGRTTEVEKLQEFQAAHEPLQYDNRITIEFNHYLSSHHGGFPSSMPMLPQAQLACCYDN